MSQISGEETIDVNRIGQVATIQATMATTEANIQATGSTNVAAVRTSQAAAEATDSTTAETMPRGTNLPATSTEAAVRAQEAASVAGMQAGTIGADFLLAVSDDQRDGLAAATRGSRRGGAAGGGGHG